VEYILSDHFEILNTHFFCDCIMHSDLLLPGIRTAETVSITYVDPDGTETTVEAEIGKNLLDAAHDNNVELEGMYVAVVVMAGVKWQTKQSIGCHSSVAVFD
jgi:hypothetical protein